MTNIPKYPQLFNSSYFQPGEGAIYVMHWSYMGCRSHSRTCCWRGFLTKPCNLAMGFLYKPVSTYLPLFLVILRAHRLLFGSVVAALCAPIYIFCLPSIKPSDSAEVGAIRAVASFDWFGWILSTGATMCISFALTNGGNIWQWQDYRTIIFCVFFGVLIAATALQQRLHPFTTVEKRLFPPPHILKDRTITILNIQTAVTIANIFVPLYFIPLYFQFVHGDTAIDAAARLLPFVLVFVTTSLLSGAFLHRIKSEAKRS